MLKDISGLAITALAFLIAFPFALGYLSIVGFGPTHGFELANESLFYIIILATFSSAVAVVGFNILIKYTSTLFASSVTYIIPVFAIMWGMIDGETILWTQVIWLIVVILGISLVNKKVS